MSEPRRLTVGSGAATAPAPANRRPIIAIIEKPFVCRKSVSSASFSAAAVRSAMLRLSSSSYWVRRNSLSPASTGVTLPLSRIRATLRSICSRTVAV